MAGRSDPLSILRDFHIHNKEIQERDELVIFDDIAFRKDAKTNYLIWNMEKNAGPEGYYSLGCLVFFAKHIDQRYPEYMRDASKQQIEFISRPDRKDLAAYLKGDIDTVDRINKLARIALPVPFNKRSAEEQPPAIRRARLTEPTSREAPKPFKAPESTGATVSTEKLSSLSDKLTAEELAALKAKRLAKKRSTIRADDDLLMPMGEDLGGILPDTDADLQEIVARERVCRTRADITKGSKDLGARLAPIFAMIKLKEEGRGRGGEVINQNRPSIPISKAALAPVGYNRYEQEHLAKADVTDFGINTMSSFRGAPNNAAQTTPTGKTAIPAANGVDTNAGKRPSKTPIIVIPSAPTSLITMFNCVDILQDNKFVAPEVKKAEFARDKRSVESEVLINRKKSDGVMNAIKVIDNPAKLTAEDWERVVAVFVQGQAWQFKGWPWNGNPVDIFDKVRAFHIKYDEMPTDKNVASWNVQVIPVSRTKRHLDRASLLKFWESLDKFVVKNRPHLRW